jgi:hypothetical protein
MPRVLILGLYYPPANFIAGRRLEGWARHLPSFGYEPLVLTRYYDPEERNKHDFYASSRRTRTLSEPWVEENGAVYTKFAPSLWTRMPLPGRVRGIGHFAWPDPDHSIWFRQCYDYIQSSKFKPDIIIASCSPPGLLRVARKLSSRLRVPWVADFRDLWIDTFNPGFDLRLKCFFQRRHLRSAAGITVVADAMVDIMREQLAPMKKSVRLIYSGAEPLKEVHPDANDQQAIEAFERVRSSKRMLLTYAGTLYPAQEIERFLDTVAEFNRRNDHACGVILCGSHAREQFVRWPFVEVIGPVSHSTALFFQRASTALFYPTWPQRYSGFSGKVFEQILSGRPVLISFQPSADLERLCQRFSSLLIAKESEDLIKALERLPQMSAQYEDGNTPLLATKKYWAGELARFLDEILGEQK